jgi:Domain of unknown function (DUF4372)
MFILNTYFRCVGHYYGGFKVRLFSCRNEFLWMTFAQVTYRESYRDIEVCLCEQ